MIFSMTAFDEIEGAAVHVSEVQRQLNFPMNLFRTRLVVPGVAMPAMKVALSRQGFPALRFRQFVVRSQVSRQNLFYQRMECEIDESLVEEQDVFDHVTIGLSLLIA